MKKIKIFLASSLVELADKRNELARFILGLNNNLIDNNTYIDLELCEELGPEMAVYRKQDEYNAFIQNADCVFFLFLSDVGKYTREEFEVAYQHFKEKKTPKIFTYFYMNGNEFLSDKVKAFADQLDQKYGHYYCFCNNIDTIKLALLLQISKYLSGSKPLFLKDGHLYLDEIDCMSIQYTDALRCNEEYQEILQEIDKIDKKIAGLAGYRDHFGEVIALNERKDKLEQRRKMMEEHSFAYISRMYDDIIKGNMSQLKKQVYRLVEQGKIKEADQVLSKAVVDNFYQENEAAFERQMAISKECIDLYQQKISLTYMQELTNEHLELIHSCYKNIQKIVERTYRFENELIPYLQFLEDTDNPEIEEVIEFLLWCHARPRYKVSLSDVCSLYREIIRHYYLNEKNEKARDLLEQLIHTVETSDEEDPVVLYEACELIYKIYCDLYPIRLLALAEKWLKKALGYIEMTEKQKEGINTNYMRASVYQWMGVSAGVREHFQEMEESFEEALKYMQKLYQENPEKWADKYAQILHEWANIYANTAGMLQREMNDYVTFKMQGGDHVECSKKVFAWNEMAGNVYKRAHEFAKQHMEKFHTWKSRKLYSQSLLCLGNYYDKNRQIVEASDAYWEYVGNMLEIYKKAPYEAVREILDGFSEPIHFWIWHHIWGDADYALSYLEEITKEYYDINPVKYGSYESHVRELREEFWDEKEWDF